MSTNFVVSVVIATRNRAESLRDTLASLTRQSRRPDEVIVVDNASGDHTRDVALNFVDSLNLKYVYAAKRGIPYARNAGIQNARGDIIAFIDDDCLADENWLKNLEIPFVKDPHIGVVGGEISYFKIGDDMLEAFYIQNMTSGQRGDSRR
jgi:glycosyltransferase involved in cell wall biosynthesis